MSKRNRNENFDQTDIDLLLNLVNSHKDLIESSKQDDKRQVNKKSQKILTTIINKISFQF